MGLLAFVPLGDVLERRGLMMRMYGAVAVALLLVALAPTLNLLIAGSVLIGMFASVTHVALPIAPDLVSHEQRGRAIGTVMTGCCWAFCWPVHLPDGSAAFTAGAGSLWWLR